MRLFAKIYADQDIDVVSFECDPATTVLRDIKRNVINLTNLDDKDSLRIIFRGVHLAGDDVSLWDLSAKEDDTVHVVVEKLFDAGKTFRVLRDRNQFNLLRDFTDQILVNMLSFLDSQTMSSSALVCRKWSYLTLQNQPLWRWNCSHEFAKDSAASNPLSVSMGGEPGEEADAGDKDGGDVSIVRGQHPFKDWLTVRASQRSKWQRVARFTSKKETDTNEKSSVTAAVCVQYSIVYYIIILYLYLLYISVYVCVYT